MSKELNVVLWDDLKEVPKEAKKEIRGGRMNGKTDINPMWRWHKLTEVFGPCGVGWRFDVENVRREDVEASDEVLIFVTVLLSIKHSGEWSEPIPGTGGSKMVSKERGGLYIDDDAVKKATTDALGVAAKMLGLGSDVYSQNADWTKYSNAYKPSEHPPAEEKTHATKDQQTLTIATAYEKLALANGDPVKLEAAEEWATDAPGKGLITARDGRKFLTEVLLAGERWDDAQAHLVKMENNSYLTKGQVAEYMARVDAGRMGPE